jgi:hypothetical protein
MSLNAACTLKGGIHVISDAIAELMEDASTVWRPRGFRVEYDESRLPGNNRLRPGEESLENGRKTQCSSPF